MVEPALVGVGVLAASVLVAVLLGLLLGRGAERLFRRGRRDRPSDDPGAVTAETQTGEIRTEEAHTGEPQPEEARNARAEP